MFLFIYIGSITLQQEIPVRVCSNRGEIPVLMLDILDRLDSIVSKQQKHWPRSCCPRTSCENLLGPRSRETCTKFGI